MLLCAIIIIIIIIIIGAPTILEPILVVGLNRMFDLGFDSWPDEFRPSFGFNPSEPSFCRCQVLAKATAESRMDAPDCCGLRGGKQNRVGVFLHGVKVCACDSVKANLTWVSWSGGIDSEAWVTL